LIGDLKFRDMFFTNQIRLYKAVKHAANV